MNLGQNCHTNTGHVISLTDTADNDIDHCSEAGENSAGIVLKDTLQINAPKKRKATAKVCAMVNMFFCKFCVFC